MGIINNLRKVMTGTVISQFIAVGSLPLISRMYEPDELGFYALCLSLVSIIGMTSSLRLERSLFSLYGSCEYNVRLAGSVVTSIAVSVMLTFLVYIISSFGLFDFELLYIVCIFCWGWFNSLIQIFVVVSSVRCEFSKIAKSSILRSITLVFFQIILFYTFKPETALVISAAFSSLICALMLIRNSSFDFKLNDVNLFFKSTNSVNDSCNGFAQSIFSAVNNNSSLIIISTLWGGYYAGLFLLADKLIRIPINLISNNLRPVTANFYQDAENRSLSNICKIASVTTVCSMLIVFLINICIEDVINLFLGDKWNGTVNIIKILSLWIIANFLSLPFQSLNLHYSKMTYTTYIEFITLIVKLISLAFVYYIDMNINGACYMIVLTAFVNAMLNVAVSVYSLKSKRVSLIL